MTFMLYFSHVSHDQFDTICQQVWLILHYPLHMALLLTVEGSSFLILSGVIGHITDAWGRLYPLSTYPDWRMYFDRYSRCGEVISKLSASVEALLDLTFKDRAA